MNFVTRIKTPLLIKHASEDLRTGVSQSEMLYRALKDLGQPVEYVRYPGEGHDLSRSGDPLRRMDRLNRMIEWFERWVDNPRAAPVATSSN
jgi:dipeptidyl aminopeptidase/acylaminoacyl peptidase